MRTLALAVDLAPMDFIHACGGPNPVQIPSGKKVGPFELIGAFDFDAAAETTIVDLTDPAVYQDDFKAGLPTGGTKLSIVIAIWGLFQRWIDQHVLDHADPEDVYRVFEGVFLEAVEGNTTTKWFLGYDGNCVTAQPVGLVDSDQATETRAYKYKTHGLKQFPEGTLIFDLETIDSLKLKATASAAASLLGSNGDTRLVVQGCAWRKDDKGWIQDVNDLGTKCTKERSHTLLRDNASTGNTLSTINVVQAPRF